MRIVSLVPSATEIVALLGAADQLIGRSHECDFPAAVQGAPVLTAQTVTASTPREIDEQVRSQLATGRSLYRLDESLLRALKPDLILTQDLCHVCSIDAGTVQKIAAGMAQPPRVLSLNPHTVEQVLDDVLAVAEAIGRRQRGADEVVKLRARLNEAQDYVNAFEEPIPTAFIEWTDPLFAAGHWTPQLIERAGGRHTLHPTAAAANSGAAAGPQMAYRTAGASRQVSSAELTASAPQAMVISPCGMDLAASQAAAAELHRQKWFQMLPAVRAGRVAVVDGQRYFSRPGPRIVDGFEFLVGWLQGRREVVPAGFAWSPLATHPA